MFFSIAAIANQQNDERVLPVPGENSFGNAYTGSPKQLRTAPIISLGQSNITISSTGPTIEVLKFPQVRDPLGVNFLGYFLGDSSLEVNLFKNYSINHRSENDARFISNTTRSLLEIELLPPNYVKPEGVNFYPYIFCASRADRRLELARFAGLAHYVEVSSYSIQFTLPLEIKVEDGLVRYISNSSRETLKFINNFYELANTGVLYVSNSSNEV